MDHVQITYRNLSASPERDATIHERVAWLSKFHSHIVGCHVVVDVPHRHHQNGNTVHVRLQVMIPGDDVIVNHEPGLSLTVDEDGGTVATNGDFRRRQMEIDAAIHDAFDIARRRLEESAQRMRREVKRHSAES